MAGYGQPGYGQPGYGQPQTVVVQQPQTVIVSPQLRDWNHGICGCFDDCGTCALGTFCPTILACMTASKMGENPCVPICIQGGMIAMRTKTRMMLNIKGSICSDCCMLMWCGYCALCQMHTELKEAGY